MMTSSLTQKTSVFKKLAACLVCSLTLSALILLIGNGGNVPWFPPEVVFPLIGIILVASIAFPFIWQYLERTGKIKSDRMYHWLYTSIRFALAINIAAFGWKKIFGLQFIVPDEIAARPLNQQSGEWLTWFYFGYSETFGLIIAFIQIIGASLLLFRRTLLLGLLLLFPLMLNLMLINICYRMNAGALTQSVISTIGIGFLILRDYDRIVKILFEKKHSGLPDRNIWKKNAIRFFAIVISVVFTMYLKSISE